jgi:RNA polymerase sigma-70 factor (ECF subfamily)
LERSEFERYAKTYKDTVFRVALNMLGSTADADDVVQETLLRLLQRTAPFESEAHARNWLVRVALNCSKNLLRAPWRRSVPLEEASETPVFDRAEDGALYTAVMALPEKYRTVLYLFYYEGYSTAEIGSLLRIRTSAVTTRLSRARNMLKTKLTEEMQDE